MVTFPLITGGAAATVRVGFERDTDDWVILYGPQVAQAEVTTSMAYEGRHSLLVTGVMVLSSPPANPSRFRVAKKVSQSTSPRPMSRCWCTEPWRRAGTRRPSRRSHRASGGRRR
ncbi:hypothetical protein [Nonomuraea sp. NPDC049028]|uniref:hypothetical protein n=1 Tax=Nonomuraea sp. NPDC049028 TaxID=3364348 RepID=UPI00371CBB37